MHITASLSPVVKYHGLTRRLLLARGFLMRPLLNSGTLGGPMNGFQWDEYCWTQNCFIPFLNAEVAVSIYPEDRDCAEPAPRQLEAFASARELSPTLCDLLDDAADVYRANVKLAVGLDWPEVRVINRDNIRAHYRLHTIFVPRLGACALNYLFLQGECDWEEEHGIEFLLRDGTVVYCKHHTGLMQNRKWSDYIAVGAPDRGPS